MIVVKVELWSAITGQHTEIARMIVDNIGGTPESGDYRTRILWGQTAAAFDRTMSKPPMSVQREGRVTGHARLKEHVWNLVAKALSGMGYGL
jgi:hypothetical protein